MNLFLILFEETLKIILNWILFILAELLLFDKRTYLAISYSRIVFGIGNQHI